MVRFWSGYIELWPKLRPTTCYGQVFWSGRQDVWSFDTDSDQQYDTEAQDYFFHDDIANDGESDRDDKRWQARSRVKLVEKVRPITHHHDAPCSLTTTKQMPRSFLPGPLFIRQWKAWRKRPKSETFQPPHAHQFIMAVWVWCFVQAQKQRFLSQNGFLNGKVQRVNRKVQRCSIHPYYKICKQHNTHNQAWASNSSSSRE